MKSDKQRKAARFEEDLARMFSGRTVAGSGASWSHDADVRADRLLIEAKYTDFKSYSVGMGVWRKIEKEAARSGLVPVLALRLEGGAQDLAVLGMDDLRVLLGAE